MTVIRFHVLACLLVATASNLVAQGWQDRAISGPSARGFVTMTYDQLRGVCVLFGGWNGSILGDTWEYDGNTWTQRSPATAPPARCCHAMTFDATRGVTVMFGGAGLGDPDLGDTWEWDGNDWTQRFPANSPLPRRVHRMVFSFTTGKTFLFGGGVTGLGSTVLDDTWEYDGNDWTQLNPASSPPARWAHGLVEDLNTGNMVVFGGSIGTSSHLQDQWEFDGNDWQQVASQTPPGLRARVCAQHVITNGATIAFGGHEGPLPLTPSSETWVFSGGAWRQDMRPGPTERTNMASAYDLIRDRVVVFGGYHPNQGNRSDTWEFDPAGLASFRTFGQGCGGTLGVPVISAPSPAALLGAQFDIELSNIPATGPAWIAFGFSRTQANGLPLPASLDVIGATGCQLLTSQEAVFPFMNTGGTASLQFTLTSDTALIGTHFYNQGFAVEAGANPLGLLVSNAGDTTHGVY